MAVLGHQQIASATLQAPTTPTFPTGTTTHAWFQAHGQNVRFRIDGNPASKTVGQQFIAGDRPTEITQEQGLDDISLARAANGAILDIIFFGIPD